MSQRYYVLKLLVCTAPAIKMPKGSVYNNFTKSGDNVSCNCCDKTYKNTTATSSTNPLWYHLKAVHSITPAEKRPPQQRNRRCSKDLSLFFREEESARDVRPASRSRSQEQIIQSNSTKSVYYISNAGQKAQSLLFPHFNSEQGVLVLSTGNQLKFQRQKS